MKTDVLQKLPAVAKTLADRHGPVLATALLHRASAPADDWDYVVVGAWVEPGRTAPKRHVDSALRAHLSREENLRIGVALPLRPEHPVVQDLARAVARHGGASASGVRELRNLELNGMEMDRAYVVTFDDALLGVTPTEEQAA
jgi:hypothetical protein